MTPLPTEPGCEIVSDPFYGECARYEVWDADDTCPRNRAIYVHRGLGGHAKAAHLFRRYGSKVTAAQLKSAFQKALEWHRSDEKKLRDTMAIDQIRSSGFLTEVL